MKAPPAPVNPVASPARGGHVVHMAAKDKEREERLAAALRENLKRRKAQARSQSQETRPDKDE